MMKPTADLSAIARRATAEERLDAMSAKRDLAQGGPARIRAAADEVAAARAAEAAVLCEENAKRQTAMTKGDN